MRAKRIKNVDVSATKSGLTVRVRLKWFTLGVVVTSGFLELSARLFH